MGIRITNHILRALLFSTVYSYSSSFVSLQPWRIKICDYVKAVSFITFTKFASITFICNIMSYIKSNFSALNAEKWFKQYHFLEINKNQIFYTKIPLNKIFNTCSPATFNTYQIKKNSRHRLAYFASILLFACWMNCHKHRWYQLIYVFDDSF